MANGSSTSCTSRSLDCSLSQVSESDDSDSDSQYRSQTPDEPQPKKQKLGAAKYRTNFTNSWAKEFPFITSVRGDPYRLAIVDFVCVKKI